MIHTDGTPTIANAPTRAPLSRMEVASRIEAVLNKAAAYAMSFGDEGIEVAHELAYEGGMAELEALLREIREVGIR